MPFPLKSEVSGSLIVGMPTLITRKSSEPELEELVLLSQERLEEAPVSTFKDVVRESWRSFIRRVRDFLLFLPPLLARVLSSLEPILPNEGRDATSLSVTPSFLGFPFLWHSYN